MQPGHPARTVGQGRGKKIVSVSCQWISTEIKAELNDTEPSQKAGLDRSPDTTRAAGPGITRGPAKEKLEAGLSEVQHAQAEGPECLQERVAEQRGGCRPCCTPYSHPLKRTGRRPPFPPRTPTVRGKLGTEIQGSHPFLSLQHPTLQFHCSPADPHIRAPPAASPSALPCLSPPPFQRVSCKPHHPHLLRWGHPARADGQSVTRQRLLRGLTATRRGQGEGPLAGGTVQPDAGQKPLR